MCIVFVQVHSLVRVCRVHSLDREEGIKQQRRKRGCETGKGNRKRVCVYVCVRLRVCVTEREREGVC